MKNIKTVLKNVAVVRYLWRLLDATRYYLYNHFFTKVPSYFIRHQYLRLILNIKIGKNTAIHMGCFITGNNVKIGSNTVINRKCYLDGRYGIEIGDNVSISPECYILSLTHDVNSVDFQALGKQVKIGDYCWLGVRCIIHPGVMLGRGTVVGSGSLVTKSFLQDGQIIGGIPAKIIKTRNISNYNYKLSYFPLFDTDIQTSL